MPAGKALAPCQVGEGATGASLMRRRVCPDHLEIDDSLARKLDTQVIDLRKSAPARCGLSSVFWAVRIHGDEKSLLGHACQEILGGSIFSAEVPRIGRSKESIITKCLAPRNAGRFLRRHPWTLTVSLGSYCEFVRSGTLKRLVFRHVDGSGNFARPFRPAIQHLAERSRQLVTTVRFAK